MLFLLYGGSEDSNDMLDIHYLDNSCFLIKNNNRRNCHKARETHDNQYWFYQFEEQLCNLGHFYFKTDQWSMKQFTSHKIENGQRSGKAIYPTTPKRILAS